MLNMYTNNVVKVNDGQWVVQDVHLYFVFSLWGHLCFEQNQ